MREDLEKIFEALEDGFTIMPPMCAGDPLRFQLNNIMVWRGDRRWVSAEITSGVYSNHKYFDTLNEALEYTKTR